jgi:hypothetical protein
LIVGASVWFTGWLDWSRPDPLAAMIVAAIDGCETFAHFDLGSVPLILILHMSTCISDIAWINWATPLASLVVPEGANLVAILIISTKVSSVSNISSWAVNNSSVPFTEGSLLARVHVTL